MRLKLKVFVAAMIVSLASAAHSELAWEQTQLELHPAIGDDTAVGHFKYENKGDKQIAIKSVTTSCGCTAASAKQTAAPGEKGEVTATFKVGDRVGVQQKAITVLTDDAAHPSTTLSLKVVIPQVLELQPAFVFWQAGEAPKAKTIVAKVGAGVSIKGLDVASSSPDFVAKVEPGSSPNEFRVNVEPRQTSQGGAAALTIKASLENGKTKIFYATVRVMPQAPPVAQQPNAAPPAAGSQPRPLPLVTAVSTKPKIDICGLITSKEIESIQGEPLKESKPTGQMAGGFAISQCYLMLPTSTNSISLTVTQKGDGADARDPKQYWDDRFHREKSAESEKGPDAEMKNAGPQKIDGVGEEAFWAANRVGGELYVLKNDSYIRISVGGAGDQETKIKKSKALAELILKRL
jgi:Protein of unknown function (DUF1573)